MLTWINEKAKWVIVIFAAGIVVGLLAMDRVPKGAQSYPVGVVNDRKISYSEFDSRFKMIQQNQFQNQRLEDEQYAQLRNDIFRSFVRQIILDEQIEKAGLAASVAELKSEFKNNFEVVRSRVIQEAQYRLNAIQQQATSQEELMQRSQAYIAGLPKFVTDTTATKEDFEAWLETPEAFKWSMMLQLEEEMKNSNIPVKQLQMLVGAGVHPTTLEAKWSVERRLTDFDIDVAFASNNDFAVAEDVVDTAMVKGYFNAHTDSFFVENDAVKFNYVVLPVAATAGDEERILVGKPYVNTKAKVVDEKLNPVKQGEAGELLIFNDYMSHGYYKLPELSAEKWIELDGTVWFRTGDRAVCNPDGDYDILGRIDNMVKLRGFRVETGEVEAQIANAVTRLGRTDVGQIVVVVKNITGSDHLSCYYEAKDELDKNAVKIENLPNERSSNA